MKMNKIFFVHIISILCFSEVSLSFFGLSSLNPVCKSIEAELKSLRVPLFAGQQTLSEYERRANLIYQSLSEKIFRSYIDQDIKPATYIQCLHDKSLTQQAVKLESIYLAAAFFRGTLRDLMQSRSAKVQRFAQDVEAALDSGAITFLDINMPSDLAGGPGALQFGGFHRGQNGLYMNPNFLPSSHWFLIFFHEFAHALDSSLKDAVTQELQTPLIPTLEEAIQSSSWSRDQEKEIGRLIKQSFDRGFVGEYRAWMTALSLYFQSGRTPYVEWAEQMIGNRSQFDRQAQKNLFQFLDPRFENQAVGVFADPRIQNIYQNTRSGWRRAPPSLGNLQRYL